MGKLLKWLFYFSLVVIITGEISVIFFDCSDENFDQLFDKMGVSMGVLAAIKVFLIDGD